MSKVYPWDKLQINEVKNINLAAKESKSPSYLNLSEKTIRKLSEQLLMCLNMCWLLMMSVDFFSTMC